jgi:hypothetical protein
MLTKSQFKALLILFDDKGHAGWELAEKLGMEDSNLNPLLKKLEQKNFIFRGERKSTKPLKAKGKKKEGDYKEFPYYLNKDLTILGKIIEEMAVTNRFYSTGFPFQNIESSQYMRSMRAEFKQDFNKLLAHLSKEHFIHRPTYSHMIESPKIEVDIAEGQKELHFLNYDGEDPHTEDKVVTKESLKELEVWWVRYNLTMCRDQDPVDWKEISRIVSEDVPEGYKIGDDIKEVMIMEASKLSDL